MRLLALALAAQVGAAQLPPAPVKLWDVAWKRRLVAPTLLEWKPREFGGPAVDPVTRTVVTVAGDVALGAYSDGTLAALDLLTGTVRWERRIAPAADFMDLDSTPRVQGGRVFVAAYSGAVLALDLATGQDVWQFKTPSPLKLALGHGLLVAA